MRANQTSREVLVYWRRVGQPAFPVESSGGVEVLTPAEAGASMEVGPADGDWNAINGAVDDIDEQLGLCGSLHEISAICDAMHVSAAIHEKLGKTPADWHGSGWKRGDLDAHDAAAAERLFQTVGILYGDAAEDAARHQYACP